MTYLKPKIMVWLYGQSKIEGNNKYWNILSKPAFAKIILSTRI